MVQVCLVLGGQLKDSQNTIFLYDAVVEDRVSRGGVFNDALLSFYLERHRSMVTKPNRAIDPVDCKAIPRDNLDMFDPTYNNVVANGFDQARNRAQV